MDATWAVALRLVDDDDLPVAQMEDVPSVLSSVTAALRPNEADEIYETGCEVYPPVC